MLERLAGPVERPIDESGRHEDNRRIRQYDAPVRENPLVEVACHESGKLVGDINTIHY